jgi:hypothetical protein
MVDKSSLALQRERGDGDMVLMQRLKKHIEVVLEKIRELSEFRDYVNFIPILDNISLFREIFV